MFSSYFSYSFLLQDYQYESPIGWDPYSPCTKSWSTSQSVHVGRVIVNDSCDLLIVLVVTTTIVKLVVIELGWLVGPNHLDTLGSNLGGSIML